MSTENVVTPVKDTPDKNEEEKGPSKKALKKAEKDKKKAEQKAANKAKQDEIKSASKEEEKNDNFGVLPLIQSQSRPRRPFANIKDLDESKDKQSVLVRARVHALRGTGNLCFLVLRQRLFTIQAVVAKGKDITKSMVNFIAGIARESIVDVEGVISVTKDKIVSTSQQTVEISIQKFFLVSASESALPLQLEDASRPKSFYKKQAQEISQLESEIKEIESKIAGKETTEENKDLVNQLKELQKKKSEAQKYVKVKRETRLDNRILDLRTPANQAVFKLQSAVCQLFREYLLANEFTEIHSPKIIGAASEGGSEVFKVKYFDSWAFLAQSPQLYKQMAISADMDRVFEVCPIFRAEKSFTHRHLTEFVGLDLEMSFYEHYHEVLDVLDGLFVSIFDGITKRFAKELEIIGQQFPFEPLKYNNPSLRLTYLEGVDMLKAAGEEMGYEEDLSTAKEKHLGKLVKEKYGVDFYILDRFPKAVRPFYTMPSTDDERFTNSYDFFLRGEEIMSGAQRIHDPSLLEKRAKECAVDPDGIKDYINSFKYGAAPHGGGGIGLERVVMLYLGLSNIRQTSLFPRDPNRTTP